MGEGCCLGIIQSYSARTRTENAPNADAESQATQGNTQFVYGSQLLDTVSTATYTNNVYTLYLMHSMCVLGMKYCEVHFKKVLFTVGFIQQLKRK